MTYEIDEKLIKNAKEYLKSGEKMSDINNCREFSFNPLKGGGIYRINYKEIDMINEVYASISTFSRKKELQLELSLNIVVYPKRLGRDIFTAKKVWIENITYLKSKLTTNNYQYLMNPYTSMMCDKEFKKMKLKKFLKVLINNCDKGRRHALLAILNSFNEDFAIKNNLGSISELKNYIKI